METPRAFSSGRRSVSMPVSARTSAVLPWSTWPMTPSARRRAGVMAAGLWPGPRPAPSICSSLTVSMSSSSRPSAMRATTGGRPRRRRPARASAPSGEVTARARLPTGRPGKVPPPVKPSLSTTAQSAWSPSAAPSRSARACRPANALSKPAERGDLAHGALRIAVKPQRRFQRGERHLVEPHGAQQRMAAQRPPARRRARPAGRPAGRPSTCRR